MSLRPAPMFREQFLRVLTGQIVHHQQQIGVRQGIVRGDRQRLAVTRHRFRVNTLIAQRAPEIVVDTGIARFELQRPAVAGHRLFEIILRMLQDPSQIYQRFRVTGRQLQQCPETVSGFIEPVQRH